MIHLNVGNKWSFKFLARVKELNKLYKKKGIRVSELYGSPGTFNLGVRPDDRLPGISHEKLKNYIQSCTKAGISVSYTANRSCVADLIENKKKLVEFQKNINWLVKLGIRRFVVFSPYLVKNVEFPEVTLSTIHNNNSLNYIEGLIDLSKKVKRICLPIYLNREFLKLTKLINKWGKLVEFELIVNEFCVSYANTCIYRAECYNIQSHNRTTKYPFNRCSFYRMNTKNGVAWLKCPFILPQWLDTYKQLGIASFKLTGRTHSDQSILRVLEYYMSKNCDISIEELWGTGLPGQKLVSPVKLSTKKLATSTFLRDFITKKISCDDILCGDECRYCDAVAKKLSEERNEGKIRVGKTKK